MKPLNNTKKQSKQEFKKFSTEIVPNSTNIGTLKFLGSHGYIEGTDLFVRWENLNTALNRDKVEYVLIKNLNQMDESKKFEAKITKIIERFKIHFVGEVVYKEENKTFVLLDNPKINRVVVSEGTNYSIGEKVKIKLTNFDLENLEGKIEKTLGNKSALNIESISTLEDYGVSYQFPHEVKEAAQKINLDIEKHKQDPLREDFTNIPFVTIDPENSKDFDDAIFVHKKENYFLYVAISDVWTYIRDQKPIVKEASIRTSSIYFLNSVIPMLPEKLSNNLCSLVPNEERCAIVFNVQIDKTGKILWKTMDIKPGIIKSKRRFTYQEVNDFFQGKNDLSEDNTTIKNALNESLDLYRVLEENRQKKGYISINSPELKIQIDDKGEITSIKEYKRGDAQIMIENFMILANEGVARYMEKTRIPSIYRIHEKPDTNKMVEFIQEARKLKFKIDDNYTPITQALISEWFKNNKHNQHIEIIKLLLLRSMQKARYSPGNLGHFGLNLQHYLHFTSPIRRYPDTMVHKMLWEYKFEKNSIPMTLENPIFKKLSRIADKCTSQEIIISEISKEIENNKLIKYMNTKLNSVFKARVLSTSKNGGYVRIDEILVEGFVKYRCPLNIGKHILVKPIHNSKDFKFIKML